MLSVGLISVLVGFLGALTGLGGASILIPILVLCGIPVKEAIASGMVAIIATSSGSVLSYAKKGIVSVRVATYLQMFAIVGAVVGAVITTKIHPTYLYFLFAAFLVTAFIRFRGSISGAFVPSENQDTVSKWLDLRGVYLDEYNGKVIEYRVNNAILGGMGMLVAGLGAGMLGIGAGAFNVTIQEHILKMPRKASSATSNLIIGTTALAGVSVYLFSGLLNLTLVAPMLVGTTIGAAAAGRILNKMSDRTLRILFLGIVTIVIIQMLYKGVMSV